MLTSHSSRTRAWPIVCTHRGLPATFDLMESPSPCPCCGVVDCRARFDELSLYTVAPGRDDFIHQHVVDAYGAQHVNESSKPIAVIFTLMGLYLWLEKGFSGLQVQHMHMVFGKRKWQWPKIEPPRQRIAVNVATVLEAEPGPERDAMIRKWGEAVWSAYAESERGKTRRVVDEAAF